MYVITDDDWYAIQITQRKVLMFISFLQFCGQPSLQSHRRRRLPLHPLLLPLGTTRRSGRWMNAILPPCSWPPAGWSLPRGVGLEVCL